jgi:hypothetical protein
MFFITFYATIARFLIRTRVKYPETLKGSNLKFLDQFFLNLAQYFRMDERTIVPILSNFRHFSMLLQFILKYLIPWGIGDKIHPNNVTKVS